MPFGNPPRRKAALTTVILILAFSILSMFSCDGGDGERPSEHTLPAETDPAANNVTPDPMETLTSLTLDLPLPVRSAIEADPAGFVALLEEVLEAPEELTWLVDKNNPLPSGYEPDDLVALSGYDGSLVLNRNDLSLRRIVLPDLQRMVNDAREQGITLDISSSYRSYAYQDRLFQRNVEQLGLEQAERESARPGTSQHQLGTTVDFGSVTPAFADTPAGIWLAENAGRYGFSLSYPEGYEEVTGYMYESWHFRYIGIAAAQLERLFFTSVQQYMLEFLNTHRSELVDLLSPGERL